MVLVKKKKSPIVDATPPTIEGAGVFEPHSKANDPYNKAKAKTRHSNTATPPTSKLAPQPPVPAHVGKEFQRQDACLNVASGARRCFTLAEPHARQPPRPAPVLLMHHGNGTDGLRFCIDSMKHIATRHGICLLYTSPSPRDRQKSRMPSSA